MKRKEVIEVKLKSGPTALVFGSFMALMHLIWMVMVFLGIAKWYLDWIFGLHLLTNPYKVLPFSFSAAIMLLVFTFVVGYVAGWVFAFIWNKLHRG